MVRRIKSYLPGELRSLRGGLKKRVLTENKKWEIMMSYSIGRLRRLNFKMNPVEITLESHWDLPEISLSEVVRN